MKFLFVFLALSNLAFCEANYREYPFPNRIQKRLSEKRFTEEEAEKAGAELQHRVQQECYPSAMACSMKCGNKPSTCSECEEQMSKCVHRITGEIYAAHNLVYPYGKRNSILKGVDKGLQNLKQRASQYHFDEVKLLKLVKNRCLKPGRKVLNACKLTAKSFPKCVDLFQKFLYKCSKEVLKKE